MQRTLLALAAAGSVAANAVITGLPKMPEVIAAINPSDPEYTACSAANKLVGACLDTVGGAAGINAGNVDKLINCACCISSTAISPAYSICSTYLTKEAPALTSEIGAYATFYSLCGDATCGGSGGAASGSSIVNTLPSRTNVQSSGPTSASSADAGFPGIGGGGSASGAPASVTASAGPIQYPPDCLSMVSYYTSCTNKVQDFGERPFREQASCICCQGSAGSLTFNSDVGSHASTCSKWAITGEPNTALGVARTYATFCSRFSDVCSGGVSAADATTTSGPNAESTSGSDGNGSGSGNRVTVTVPASTSTKEGSLAPTAGVAIGAVIGAIGAFVAAL